ncbi:uncharacterized protein LOC144169059 [Haemaphysalis longicornis]
MNVHKSMIPCAIIVIACTLPIANADLPERKPYLTPFQDAWKAFLQHWTYVIYQRSFEHDPVYDLTGRCVHGRVEEWDHERQIATTKMRYWDNSQEKFLNRTVYMTPDITEGYTVPNVLVASLGKEEKLLSVHYPIAVSEYMNCDILRVPHRSNGCEMWIILEKIHEVSSICFFIYDLICGPTKIRAYEEEFCAKKMAK